LSKINNNLANKGVILKYFVKRLRKTSSMIAFLYIFRGSFEVKKNNSDPEIPHFGDDLFVCRVVSGGLWKFGDSKQILIGNIYGN